MTNNTKVLSENTKLFSSLPPEVAVLIIDVIDAIASVLAWRQSSKSLLSAILSRLAEREFFEKDHKNFSFAMWSHLEVSRRKEKFSRWLSNLKGDQKLSKINLIWVENRRVKRNEGGEFQGLPTLYKRGRFWELFECVQFVAKQCDLLDFPVDDRRAQIRDIVANWLKEAGAVKIIREKKEKIAREKSQKEKSDSPPSSEIRIDKQDISAWQVRLEDEQFEFGQTLHNGGQRLSIVDNKLNAICTAARVRLKAAVSRSQGRGDFAPDTSLRVRGRSSQEVVIAEMREMRRIAEEMGKHQHAEKLEEWARILENWKVFRSREVVK